MTIKRAFRHSKNELFVETSKLLNSTLDLDELLDLVLNLSARIMEAQASSLLLIDEKSGKLRLHVSPEEKAEGKRELELKMGEGIAGWVAEHIQPVISNRVKEDPRYCPELEERIGFSIDSLICIPLLRRGRLIGVVTVLNKMNGKEFDQEDLEVFSSLADQIAIALDNSYLFGKLKKKTLETETLLEVEKSLSSTLDLSELLELILDSLLKVVRYDAVVIFLVDRKKQEIEHIKARGFDPALEPDLQLKIGEGVAGWAAKTQESLIVPDVKEDPRYIEARVETKSGMVVPIVSQNRTIGVFSLESDELNAYGHDDLELLEAFASLAAISLERARQHEEILKKRKLEEELSIAKRIQQSFLPRAKPRLPGFDISGINIPSEEVGGDYYDFIPIIENQIGIIIADVSGKGIPAALIMASVRAGLIAEIRNNYAIRSIMAKVNNLLFESTASDIYVTAVYGVLDPKNRIFTFSNAGHNAPILRRADGEMKYLTEGGMALGMFENSKYEERPLGISPGEIIVFYTDGVTEAKNDKEEEFGTRRLKQVIGDSHQLGASQIQENIYDAVKEFTGLSHQEDDLTMIVVKIRD
ncbi:MAG: GAF domain-containing SpoIIE family protein phosphatase [Candidatus Zixiibacteriota bacterium]